MVIIYSELESQNDAYYRQRPGQAPFFCFDVKFKGDTEAVLHWITFMLEANRLMYPAQKLAVESTLVLKNGKVGKFVGNEMVWPVRSVKAISPIPMLAQVCPN